MIQANKSLIEIKKAIIGIETLTRTRQAHANTVRDFVHSKYDRQHNPMNSPQRDHWRNRHDRGSSRSPSQGSRYGRPVGGSGANASLSHRSGDSGNVRSSYKKRVDGYRDRSRSRSPYNKSGYRSQQSSSTQFTRDQYRADRSRHRSPTPTTNHRSRDFPARSRSPSPGGTRPTRKHVGFSKPVAQNVVGRGGDSDADYSRGQGADDGPSSRESPDDGVDPDLTGHQDTGDSESGVAHLARQ